MLRFSVIIPVFNRPDELRELLLSLTRQTYTNFDVLVIEDGSMERAEAVVQAFTDRLAIRYFEKPNSGQGFTRNYGFERATGDYFVIFDSDALVPPHYFETVSRHGNGVSRLTGRNQSHGRRYADGPVQRSGCGRGTAAEQP